MKNMGKAIKCPACGAYYNGAVYSNCPYCSNSGNSTQATAQTKKPEQKGGLLGLIGKKSPVANQSAQTPSTQNKEIQPNPISKPTAPLFSTMESQKEEPAVQVDAPPENKHEPKLEHKVEPAPGLSLSQAISRSGRTVGKYISANGSEGVAPVVGWLVGVKGASQGQSFNLKSGKNKIGRSHEMDVKLLGDESVSRTSAAVIVYDAKAREFSILPGDSDSLCYVNDKAVYERLQLCGYEKIEFGDAGLNMYVFVPFCGERFSWSDYIHPQNK